MLVAIDSIAVAERFNYYKGVGYLIRRLEHGGVLLKTELGEGVATGDEVALCLQYRGFLFAALKQTAHVLSSRTENNTLAGAPVSSFATLSEVRKDELESLDGVPAVVQAYCAQVLAVLAFRVPELMRLILKHGLAVGEDEVVGVNENMRAGMNALEEQMKQTADAAPAIKSDKKGLCIV